VDIQSKMAHLPLAVGGLVAGGGLIYAGISGYFGKKDENGPIPEYAKPFLDLVDEKVVRDLIKDSTWAELCDRAGDFATIAKDEFVELLLAVSSAVLFATELEKGKKMTHGTPRIYRSRMHAIIEAVRNMRAAIESKFPASMDDFDDVAADIQRTHDDYSANMLLEAQSLL
jgi:hypothetical protein